MEFDQMLHELASKDGSDLYLATGAPASAKFQGKLIPLVERCFEPGEINAIADAMMDSEQKLEFEQNLEMNLAISVPGIGRFRVNIFQQRNEISIVARNTLRLKEN